MTIPQWAKDQRQKGTEIKKIGGRYYLCKVSSKWDPELKRARKISGEYLGVLTPEGLVPVKRRLVDIDKPVISKEYGASWLLTSLTEDIRACLKVRFPDIWQEIYTVSMLRTIRPCALRYIEERYTSSLMSELLPGLGLSGASLTNLLKDLGQRREAITLFMQDFLQGEQDYLIFDGTNLVSFSDKMSDAQLGYNSKGNYDPQVNLLYAFKSSDSSGLPAYYRKFPGSIRDVSAFIRLVEEIGVKDAVMIADKGFGSAANFTTLDEAGLKYIVPLRRNSKSYDRQPLLAADKSGFDGVLQYNDRPIWYYSGLDGAGRQIVVYLDGVLRLQEEKDYMRRFLERHDGYDEAGLRARQLEFGTIVLMSNLNEAADQLYFLYKKRGQIEQMFDDYKNLLSFDTSYLQSDQSMEAWLFLNHLGLMTCYRVFDLLRSTQSLKKYSVCGVLQEYLSGIRIDKINGSWRFEVMTKGQKKLIKQLKINLPDSPVLTF